MNSNPAVNSSPVDNIPDVPYRHLRAVAQFGRQAICQSDLDALLHEACTQVANGIGVRYAKVLEYRAEEGDFLIRAGVGWEPGIVGTVRAPATSNHPPGLAMVTKEPVIVRDVRVDPRFVPTPLFREYGIVSLVNVPILLEDHVFGVLEVVTPDNQIFTDHEISFLQGFANLIAAVVQRRQIDQSLAAALREKDVLLKELQHRVKNNLNVVIGLLGLQASRLDHPAGRQALTEVQGRVHAIGLAYGVLEASQEISRLDLAEYLAGVCRHVLNTRQRPSDNIDLKLDMLPLSITLQNAVPLGLIVNELISNSLQHAFPDGHGTISLSLGRNGDRLILRVGDNGRGMGPPRKGSLGMTLVRSLVGQIQGQLEQVPSAVGVTYQIDFGAGDD